MAEKKAGKATRRFAWGRYLLVFLVAAWMFALGVLVGRGTAPLDFDALALQKELAALRDAMVQKQRQAVEKAIRGEDEKAPLDFYEALQKDDPDTTVQIPLSAALTDASTFAEPADEGEKPPHKSPSAALTQKAASARQTPATESGSAAQAPVPSQGRLTIQVASLQDAAAATRIVDDLKKSGYPAYLSSSTIPGQGTWFRVRVGSYANREAAAADMARLIASQQKPILMIK